MLPELQQERLAVLGRLVASVVHEVNNPLSVIDFALQLLRRDAELTAFQQEMAGRIEEEVHRLRDLTEWILPFSSGRLGSRRLVNLNTMIEEMLGLLRFELQREAVSLETDLTDLPLVSIDPQQIRQVLINLVTNAAHAMGGQGVVTIRTGRSGSDGVYLVVSDTGPGVPPALRAQIFTPFFTTKSDGEGTGLGLYICSHIVDGHGGTLAIGDAPGGGAQFTIRLPVAG